MSETKWTPGPLTYDGDRFIHNESAVVVAEMDPYWRLYGDEREHYARLIAAAPAMAEALEVSNALLVRLLAEEAVPDSERSEIAVQTAYNDAALASARGKTDGAS